MILLRSRADHWDINFSYVCLSAREYKCTANAPQFRFSFRLSIPFRNLFAMQCIHTKNVCPINHISFVSQVEYSWKLHKSTLEGMPHWDLAFILPSIIMIMEMRYTQIECMMTHHTQHSTSARVAGIVYNLWTNRQISSAIVSIGGTIENRAIIYWFELLR